MPIPHHPTRIAARDANQKTYFTGIECGNGHLSPRWTASGKCVQCRKENRQKHKHANSAANRRRCHEEAERESARLGGNFKLAGALAMWMGTAEARARGRYLDSIIRSGRNFVR